MEFMNLGHRGAKTYAPENTMISFNLALDMGVNGLETDIRQTKDGYLVLCHDANTERLTGINMVVKESNYKGLLHR